MFVKHECWVKRSYLNGRLIELGICPNLPVRPGEELYPFAAIQMQPR